MCFLVVLFSSGVFSIIQPRATFQLNMLCFTFNSAFYYIQGDLPSWEIWTDCFAILNPKYSANDGLFTAVNVENYSVFSLIYFPFNLYSFITCLLAHTVTFVSIIPSYTILI